jgi:uncharacterized membrane protein
MANEKQQMQKGFQLRKIFQYFFQGLVIIAPVAVTGYVVLWLFNAVDDILPNILQHFLPRLMTTPDGELKKVPGVGFAVVILIVIFIGRISTSFLLSRFFEFVDNILEHTPGVKYIYSSVKDLLEAFGGNRRKFDKPVLVQVDMENVWRVGFITQKDASLFELPEHVAVYVPLSYALTGVLYIVPSASIRPLENISSAEAMKFTISGGVTTVDE